MFAEREQIGLVLGYLEAAVRCARAAGDQILEAMISVAIADARDKVVSKERRSHSSGERAPCKDSLKLTPLWRKVKELRQKNNICVDALATQIMISPERYLRAEALELDLGEVELISALAIACASEKGVPETAHDPWIWSDRQIADGMRESLTLINQAMGRGSFVREWDIKDEVASVRHRFNNVLATGIVQPSWSGVEQGAEWRGPSKMHGSFY